MDNRLTLKSGELFFDMLKYFYEKGEKIHLLIDDNGIYRTEGFVKSIKQDGKVPLVEMEDNKVISVDNIIAINGVFRSDYSEC